jgi:glucose-6-phosphate dehydrogenase assembly protein OpcA
MIINMPNTETDRIARKIEELHQERGEAGNDRVLTLIISTEERELEEALEAANGASREHPCRVIAVVNDEHPNGIITAQAGQAKASDGASAPDATCDVTTVDSDGEPTDLDAQVRFGADAGAGEVIILWPKGGLKRHTDTLVMPLLVPDIPIVTWWPTNPPENPANDPLGAMSGRRITDAVRSDDPADTFKRLAANWEPQDIDLAWTRITVWRAMLASMLDQPPHLPVTSIRLTGGNHSLPLQLLSTWLGQRLDAPVKVEHAPDSDFITGVYLERGDGTLSLTREDSADAVISLPGQKPQTVSMPLRTLEESLSEELRRIDPDEVYASVIRG